MMRPLCAIIYKRVVRLGTMLKIERMEKNR